MEMKNLLILSALAVFVLACSSSLPDTVQNPYAFEVPSNFPPVRYTLENNPVTEQGFELGRLLFYDPILSLDSSISCANCHQQAVAFSDPVHRLSKGVNDVTGIRNAPAIQNMAFQSHFFWDGGVKHLDFVPINAITNDLEMHESLEHVITKLSRSKTYPEKFKSAFGSSEITSQKMLYSLSQFMSLLVSSNSKYDSYVRGEGEKLTPDELEGLTLFQSNCSGCHGTDLFTDGSFRNNGLDETFENDHGRERITEFSGDIGKFKVPSLRNVELTSPYMHDGRFNTLQQVLEHYGSGVKDSETLDALLKQGDPAGITLNAQEIEKIIAFLKTLTDPTFTHDQRFSFPSND